MPIVEVGIARAASICHYAAKNMTVENENCRYPEGSITLRRSRIASHESQADVDSKLVRSKFVTDDNIVQLDRLETRDFKNWAACVLIGPIDIHTTR